MRTFLTCLFLIAALAACKHGRDFARPSPETLVLGSTSRADVEGNYGRPVQQSSAIRTDNGEGAGYVPATPFAGAFVAGSFSSISYVHSDETARILYGGRTKAKAVNFVFWNDVLVGYDYISTFDDDPTNFDETRINSIKKGQTTRSDLVQLLGQPTGRAVYPLIRDRAMRNLSTSTWSSAAASESPRRC